jgi:hypothetical protein
MASEERSGGAINSMDERGVGEGGGVSTDKTVNT